jgi:hypothetical protein
MNPSKPTLQEWMRFGGFVNPADKDKVMDACRRYTSQERNKISEYLYNTKLSNPVPAGAIRFYPPLPVRQPLTDVLIRSQFLQRTLGTRVAAGYLRNRKVSIETALYLLARNK